MARRDDVSALAGLLLGAAGIGASYQRSLLSRGSKDQAVITGVAAVTGYAAGSSVHSCLQAVSERIAGSGSSQGRRSTVGAAVDAAALVAGATAARALCPSEHESAARALVRLGACTTAASAGAGLVARALPQGGRGAILAQAGAAIATGAATYALTRPGQQVTGAERPDSDSGQDVVHEVAPIPAAAAGAGTAAALMAMSRGESHLVDAAARAAARTLGGEPSDHRALGRVTATALTGALAWRVLAAVVTTLTTAGEKVEGAHEEASEIPEVTGSPESHIVWSLQSREGRRWLSMVLRPESIGAVMQEPAKQPIRIYSPLESAASPEDRADLLLREVDRTRALERSVFALFSPTGSGYVNYVANETLEYLSRGDCASAAIEYSVLPSALSLTRVHEGTDQTRMVVDGIVERLLRMPPDHRPRFVLFGESLGSQVSEEMFRGTGISGPAGIGLDAAVWIGTPAATTWRDELWGSRSIADAPRVGPGHALVTRCLGDWTDLPSEDRDLVKYLLLQNGDDPIPKFGAPLLWRRPDWLGPDAQRPPGAPTGTRWLPVVTFVATFLDMANALTPTPGVFVEGGHGYRRDVPEALRAVWRLACTDQQMDRVQSALRRRELGWETDRRWSAAQARSGDSRAEAEASVEADVATWTGQSAPVDAAAIQEFIDTDTQPR